MKTWKQGWVKKQKTITEFVLLKDHDLCNWAENRAVCMEFLTKLRHYKTTNSTVVFR